MGSGRIVSPLRHEGGRKIHMHVLFYLTGAIAILSTVMVILEVNAVHALLYMIVSLFSVALIFFTLGAPFVAALEVIIYAGAIMILFVFVIMMLNLGPRSVTQERRWLSPVMCLGPALLVLILILELVYILRRGSAVLSGVQIVGPKEVGLSLFGLYLLGVELASMLLLAGLVGAYHLGRHIPARERKGEP
jgi:NADH-quinone oxidoreductase subunit J